MDANNELLNYIYQNAEMGESTIKQLIPMVNDQAFKNNLQSQLNEYKTIFDIADRKLKELNSESKGIGTLTKVSTYIMININTLVNKTPSHIAEMLIRGSTMGIIDITKRIKDYKQQDKQILDVANRLLKFEERNVDELKGFL
ncbi:hypothetical protein [Clostridium sp. 'White wine YQ']|uniref:hypothetical protein n=1 Tax=Clostridium sp. 'White wine YQ' TaxID=3027474 RepID=UPI002365BB08|nr:hypothetical protein [Clostridium sp. 'White wine YQ']MDD7793916.1 hypothetical protein [Clostridium sp. 'White wine YQ']